MTTYAFNSADPGLHDLDVDHGALGAHADAVMNHPAYLDAFHPQHMRAVSQVQAAFDAIFGSAPIPGAESSETFVVLTGPVNQGEPQS